MKTVCTKQEKLFDALMELYNSYKMVGNRRKMKQMTKEMETVESDLDEPREAEKGCLESRKVDALSVTTNFSIKIGKCIMNNNRRKIRILGLQRELELEEMEHNKVKTNFERKLELIRQSILDAKQNAEHDEEEDEQMPNLTPQVKLYVEKDKSISYFQREVGQDIWKQMTRVLIPVFFGNKQNHENLKAAFSACIDKARPLLIINVYNCADAFLKQL